NANIIDVKTQKPLFTPYLIKETSVIDKDGHPQTLKIGYIGFVSSLVLTLRDEGYISDTGDAEPAETMKIYQMLADLITSDVRLT
ncbi:hypothetical protein ONQ97_26545, partial [Salmonella enterica subsp. enterica serovar Virginia]|nr:hypothetical protein [Salmonella enterica subsp. enterica serovar Virginia]